MLIVTKQNGEDIQNRGKVASLRPVRASGKGYLKTGTIKQIRDSRNFREPPVCKVWLFGRSFVDIEALTLSDFKSLGYSSKAEYLAESFNRSNPSSERVKYSFYNLSALVEDLNGFGLVPDIVGGVICEQ